MQVSDPLSEVLKLSSAQGVMSTGLKAYGRWRISVKVGDDLKFSAITEGQCWIKLGESGEKITLDKGDCFLVRGPLSFILGNDDDVDVRAASDVFAHSFNGYAILNRGQYPNVTCLGGKMTSSEGIDHLTSSLPSFLVLKAGTSSASKVRWLLEQLETEMSDDAPGAGVMCEQIMQMIFVEMIRTCLAQEGVSKGWFSALADPRVGHAIRLMHSDVSRQWRLEELAQHCNLSRSQFAARFTEAVGVSPIEYLFQWRMHVARRALRRPNSIVLDVAEQVGYHSEASFGAAFKRMFGVAPRRYSAVGRNEAAKIPSAPIVPDDLF
ncbi:AraC family transcriptional regulator [Agrobacterium tumefaciens]|uniref:AraC family transcriptional regulator n=1 Tax=Agrobacterium tumefaciens TaxID=358 RepID=UPI00287C98D7|nr:AraC family transcriptional regulator [Agrobacterium tumefaciens]MDS7598508.1 AraC family transcriptional regulator [Agrobacterium tumefaciens]